VGALAVVNQLIKRMNNGKIKILTGIRRCGKSVLLKDENGILYIGVMDFLLQDSF